MPRPETLRRPHRRRRSPGVGRRPRARLLSTWSRASAPEPQLSVTLQDPRTLDVFIEHLSAVAPLETLHALYLEPPWRSSVDTDRLRAACARMAHTRVVGVGQRGAAALYALMFIDENAGLLDPPWLHEHRVDGEGEGEGAHTVPVFPALETLVLRCVWVRPRPHARPRATTTLLWRLRDVLHARAEAGYRLRRLMLVSCVNVVPADVAFLHCVADAVEWDGKQYFAEKGTQAFRRGDGDGKVDDDTMWGLQADAEDGTASDLGEGDDGSTDEDGGSGRDDEQGDEFAGEDGDGDDEGESE